MFIPQCGKLTFPNMDFDLTCSNWQSTLNYCPSDKKTKETVVKRYTIQT